MGPRRSRALFGLFAAVLILFGAACSPREERSAYDSINALRDAAHVAGLGWNNAVYPKAVAWSNHMADQGALSHSNLSDGVPDGWTSLGENVAYADTIERAIASLQASAPHRANMLNPAFRSVAVGVADRNGKVWVTEVFVG